MDTNTILITGGATGIGYALMEEFLAAGDTVIICGRREDKLKEAQEKNPGVHTFVCDLTDHSDRERLVNYLAEIFPQLNMIVNNAGALRQIDLQAGASELLSGADEIAINFEAPIVLTSMLMEQLLAQKQATIINISSVIAHRPMAELPLYSATKAGLHTYTMLLREQLATTDIKVVEITPPAVASEINLEIRNSLLKDLKLASAEECAAWIIAGLNEGLIDIEFKPLEPPPQ